MMNTTPFSAFSVPVPSGVVQLYNRTIDLTDDLMVGDLVLTSTTINTSGYRICCKSLTMNDSTLQNSGSNGLFGAGGEGAYQGTVGGGGNGGTSASSQVNPATVYAGALGGVGGTGGNGSYSNGVLGGPNFFNHVLSGVKCGGKYQPSVFESGYVMGISVPGGTVAPILIRGGSGGGQGGQPTNIVYGGGGGGGGGVVLINCSGPVVMYSSQILANGGNGVDGATSAGTTSGGGGGGGGGVIIIRCNSLFIKSESNHGIMALGGTPGVTAAVYGHGAHGNILVNTSTNCYYFDSGVLGDSDDVTLT